MTESHCSRNPGHRRTRARGQGTRALNARAEGVVALLVAGSVCRGSVRARHREAAAKGRARVGWLVQAVAVAKASDDGCGSGRRQPGQNRSGSDGSGTGPSDGSGHEQGSDCGSVRLGKPGLGTAGEGRR